VRDPPVALCHLLLVEDNLANVWVVEAMLRRRASVSVLPAIQGRLAVDPAMEHQPDVIVLDLHLPDLPGREVLSRLQAAPATRHIPVVVASADATPGRRDLARESSRGHDAAVLSEVRDPRDG
jgi:CheY-like chemotaxis protein